MKTVKVIRYLDGDNYKYTVDDGEDFPCERDLSGTYIELSETKAEIKLISESYEANKQGWEADIAALRDDIKVWRKLADSEAEQFIILQARLDAEQTSVNKLSLANQELHERQRVLVEALELVMGRSDRLKSALRTIKTDKSFGPNAVRLLQSIASLSLLEEAKQTNIDHACRAALAAKEG